MTKQDQKQTADPCFLTASGIMEGFASGRLSSQEIVEAHLTRIAALEPALHAFTEVFGEEALLAARASEERRVAGRALSPLDGMPIAIKDLIEIEGKVCTGGSATRLDQIARQTAPVVSRLLNNGMIVLGKTHTVEFAFGGWGTNEHMGNPRNPWVADTPFTAGGSSSGSAVAVAARMAPLALGTDTGGSVRVPSAFNGLIGLKTTPGLISLEGIVPLSPSLDTVGPIACTVTDAALLFRMLLDDPASMPDPFAELNSGVGAMTLGAVDDAELANVNSEIARSYVASLQQLERQGARIVPLRLPRRLTDYTRGSEIMMAEAYTFYAEVAEDALTQMDRAVRARILAGNLPARHYILAKKRALEDALELLHALEGCDALLTPTTATLPIPLAAVDEATTPSVLTRFVNQLGLCALAVPNNVSSSGLPISLQIVCRPRSEHLALRIGRASEIGSSFQGALPVMA